MAVDLATGELMWTLTYPEFEALLVPGKGAGAVFMTGVVDQEASLLAIDL